MFSLVIILIDIRIFLYDFFLQCNIINWSTFNMGSTKGLKKNDKMLTEIFIFV